MECLQARIDSYYATKSKRTKTSSSKATSSLKWPHPSSFKATPATLAEAGFYFSESPDSVTCFMCKKALGGWELDDDPFEIHYDKCRDVCPWAVVRCQSYDSSDPARHPTSKAMEKARLDTFSKYRWPHDAVKGHGANSKALAKAGFVCNPIEPGDDNAVCLYCNVSLAGWDKDDEPYEEHLKRSQKNKIQCAFLKAFASYSLSKSTTKRPVSKVTSKPPSRASSRTLKDVTEREDVDERADTSEDELAADALSDLTSLPQTSSGRVSRTNSLRASTVAAKTPASRRSTRGTSTTGKTPGSRTVSSEVEETDAGSESDAGRRTKSKRKAGGQPTKSRVSAIAEEDVADEGGEDVEVQTQDESVPPEKKKRGRPPKSTSAKPASKAKGKRAELKEEDEEEEFKDEPETKPVPLPAKKGHGRTRSKVNLEVEAEAAASPGSKGTHGRTNFGVKTKAKLKDDEEDDVPDPVLKKGKSTVAQVQTDEDDVAPVRLPAKSKSKGRIVSRSRIKAEPPETVVDDNDVRASEPSHSRAERGRGATARDSQAPDERKSSLSEDAGYATAEPPPETDHMDVDEFAVTHFQPKQAGMVSKSVQPSRTSFRTTPADSEEGKRPSPANGIRLSSAAPSSRASSSLPPAKLNKDSLKVIEIDSDGEETGSYRVPSKAPVGKGKAPLSRAESTVSVTGSKKLSRQTSKRQLQVEVVIPPLVRRPASIAEDVHVQMQDKPPTRPSPSCSIPGDGGMQLVPSTAGTPISAVHRSAPVSPTREGGDVDVLMSDLGADVNAETSHSPRTYHPFLAQLPIERLATLTEEDAEMTLEQYIRREMELQSAQVRHDAERRIEQFKQKAAETRRVIEAS